MEQNTQDKVDGSAHKKCDIVALEHSYNTPLPEVITKEIDHVLHLVSHVYKDGGEMPMVFVGMRPDGDAHLIDPEGIPVRPMIAMMVKRLLDKIDAVAVIMVSEGHTVPDEVAKEWIKGNRPEGMRAADHPEAIEVLMVQVETLNGVWFASSPVTAATEEGTERFLKKPLVFDRSEGEQQHTQYTNLLKQNRPADEVESPALALLAAMMGGHFDVDTSGETPEEDDVPTEKIDPEASAST